MASATEATSTFLKPSIRESPAGWAINQKVVAAAATPVIQSIRFIAFPFALLDRHPKFRGRRERVEIVSELPVEFPARLHLKVDIRLRRKNRADGPEVDARQRLVGGDAHSCPDLPVLHADI